MGTVSSIHAGDAVTALAFHLTWPGSTLRIVHGDVRRVAKHTRAWTLVHRLEQSNEDIRFEVSGGRLGAFWVRTEGTEQDKRLQRLRTPPSMVLREGSSSRRWSFWFLGGRPDLLTYGQIVKGNKRLAYACGATQKHGDPDHCLFPVPGTALRDKARPVPVIVEALNLHEYRPRQVVGALKDPPPARDWRELKS